MSKAHKDLRKQLRNVVQEILPELLKKELSDAILTELLKHMNTRMDIIAANAQKSLADMDKKTKDVLSYVIRQNTKE